MLHTNRNVCWLSSNVRQVKFDLKAERQRVFCDGDVVVEHGYLS